jgi:TolA-binding protein
MSFDRAWSLLRQGHARDAAALFAEVERDARDAGTREDALYWRAVATARTGDAAEAKRLFVDLLKRFPRASRTGQAATALGWLLLDGGDTAAAARAFERAINDESPAIRASAAEGLRRAKAH